MLEIGLDYIQDDVTCVITGDGEGAEGNVQVSEDGLGKILSVEITNVGSGYSFADISVVEQGRMLKSHNEAGRKEGWFNSEHDWDDPEGYSFGSREFS
jgi:hypothetical protein